MKTFLLSLFLSSEPPLTAPCIEWMELLAGFPAGAVPQVVALNGGAAELCHVGRDPLEVRLKPHHMCPQKASLHS